MSSVGGAHAAVLFDLDGTLIDSAPDLAGTANDLRAHHGLPALPYEALRPMVGAGARGMIGVAFDIAPGEAGYEPLRDAFLARYAERLLQHTRVFEAVEPVLAALERARMPWGIVTNKAMRYTEPVIEGLGLAPRAAVVIAGDTTPHAGPTWLRRGCGVGAGHAEHQFARKSTGNKVTANDQTYALAA
jgi:phosphoglycolate phosphatase-like HAD superfamily hydrolase